MCLLKVLIKSFFLDLLTTFYDTKCYNEIGFKKKTQNFSCSKQKESVGFKETCYHQKVKCLTPMYNTCLCT